MDNAMGRLTIEGGRPLVGAVSSSGAKNAALPILAACILLDGPTEISNVPSLMDIKTMLRMLNSLGFRAEYHSGSRVKTWPAKSIKLMAPYDLVTAMRASFFVAGPILAKKGMAKVPLPGGCAIGSRPIDIHLEGFKKMGAEVSIEHGFVLLRATELKGAEINLPFPSVGATENLVMAATLATGPTVINNAAREPEVYDLCQFLNAAGAQITGMGSPSISITPVRSLTGVTYSVIPDRIEIATLLMAGLITQGDVTVNHVVPDQLEPLLDILAEMGASIDTHQPNTIRVTATDPLKPTHIETRPFPGFPTDMQAQMMTLLSLVKGTSTVQEKIFENRFMHADELKRMGANIRVNGHEAIIEGVSELSGAEVKITDLRAGAALILAGLAATGYTTIHGLKHLYRGYENLPEKLRSLGACILD